MIKSTLIDHHNASNHNLNHEFKVNNHNSENIYQEKRKEENVLQFEFNMKAQGLKNQTNESSEFLYLATRSTLPQKQKTQGRRRKFVEERNGEKKSC